MVLLLAFVIAVPGPALLALALRRRLPVAGLPAAAMLLPAEIAALIGTATVGGALAEGVAVAGLAALVAAIAITLATAGTQLNPWWWSAFSAELASWESSAQVEDGSPLI
ncbi:MAG TPA: hypothetical protein VGI54_02440 [Solirubrobacteraceae bacterium]|jgi:hypothetical protein